MGRGSPGLHAGGDHVASYRRPRLVVGGFVRQSLPMCDSFHQRIAFSPWMVTGAPTPGPVSVILPASFAKAAAPMNARKSPESTAARMTVFKARLPSDPFEITPLGLRWFRGRRVKRRK